LFFKAKSLFVEDVGQYIPKAEVVYQEREVIGTAMETFHLLFIAYRFFYNRASYYNISCPALSRKRRTCFFFQTAMMM